MNWRSMTILRTDVHREVHGDNFEDSNSRSKDEAFELNGYFQRLLSRFSRVCGCPLHPLFQPATPRVRHVLFWHYVTSGRRPGAPSYREMYAATRTLLGSKADEGDRCKPRSPSGVVC